MYLLLVFLCSLAATGAVTQNPLFRSDYKYYSEEAKGWLKLHPLPATWSVAYQRCHEEGAVLASPITAGLFNAMFNLMENNHMPCGVFTGIHDTFTPGRFYSIEGIPVELVPARWNLNVTCHQHIGHHVILNADGKLGFRMWHDRFPFICYKKFEELNASRQCGTFDKAYIYNNETGSCYKFHNVHTTWSEAERTCSAEGGHLVVINSEAEREFLVKMISDLEKEDKTFRLSIGIVKWDNDTQWRTLHGGALYDGLYPLNTWANKNCGSISRGGVYQAVKCGEDTMTDKYYFACERTPAIIDGNM